MDATPAATVVYPPRWKLLLLVAACLFFAAIGFTLATTEPPALIALGGLGLVGFGLAAVVLLWRALRPGPTLRVDAAGVTERTTLAPTGLVPWEVIAAVRKREIGRGRSAERVLEIVLVDPAGFNARPRSAARWLADRYRALLKHPHVTIPGSMVSMPLGELIEELRRWRPELPVLELPPPPPGRFRSKPAGRQHPDLPRW